jgi:oligopeptide/dipeptide ABC transporter ATP-binding protein
VTGAGEPLLELRAVHKHYGSVRALDGVTLSVSPGETLGMVGESGSGKSTVGRIALGLERPTKGELRFGGRPYPRTARGLRSVRRRVGIVFQDPYDSLDARFTLRMIVDEPLRAHRLRRGDERVAELLTSVGMENVALDSYPGEYSGGQRQRVGIARALALEPELIVCDEPTSALDVSVQAQILNLLLELQRERGLAYLFISHDLEVVRRMSDRLAVIYAGKIVESGPTALVTSAPTHPYTRTLMDAVPATTPSERHVDLPETAAGVDATATVTTGCPFAPRCPRRADICTAEMPPLAPPPLAPGGERLVACHFPLEPEAEPVEPAGAGTSATSATSGGAATSG